MLVAGLLKGLDALEEYFTLLADDWGVPIGGTARRAGHPVGRSGRDLVDRPSVTNGARPSRHGRWRLALGAGAVLLAARSGSAAPAGLAGVAVFYGLYRIVLVAVSSRLQDAITGPARATVSSVAALLSELSAIAIYGLWALDGLAPITAAIMLIAIVLPRALRPAARH